MSNLDKINAYSEVFNDVRKTSLASIAKKVNNIFLVKESNDKILDKISSTKHQIVQAYAEDWMSGGDSEAPDNVLQTMKTCDKHKFMESVGCTEVWIHRETQYVIPENIMFFKINNIPVINKNMGATDIGDLYLLYSRLVKIIYKEKTVKKSLTDLHFLLHDIKTRIKLCRRVSEDCKLEELTEDGCYKSNLQYMKALDYMYSTIDLTLIEWNKKLKY